MNAATAKSTKQRLLAEKFISLLQRDIGTKKFQEVCKRNAKEANGSICHSHDFCDANMTMLAAFNAVFGRDADTSDADINRWNKAWALAFKAMATMGRKTVTAVSLGKRIEVRQPNDDVVLVLNCENRDTAFAIANAISNGVVSFNTLVE